MGIILENQFLVELMTTFEKYLGHVNVGDKVSPHNVKIQCVQIEAELWSCQITSNMLGYILPIPVTFHKTLFAVVENFFKLICCFIIFMFNKNPISLIQNFRDVINDKHFINKNMYLSPFKINSHSKMTLCFYQTKENKNKRKQI